MSSIFRVINKEGHNTNVSDFCAYTEGDVEMVVKEHGTFLEDYKGNAVAVELDNGSITEFTRYGTNDDKLILDSFIDFTQGNVQMMDENTWYEMVMDKKYS